MATSRKPPFIPVFINGGKNIANYFDFEHFNGKMSGKNFFRNCSIAMRLGSDEQNLTQRLHYISMADDGDALFLLGVIHEFGLMNFKMNDTLSRTYYERGSTVGHSECMSRLSLFLAHGFGGERDIPRSIKLSELASKKGSVSAMLHLSFLYRFGDGVNTSTTNAYNLLETIGTAVLSNITYQRLIMNSGVTRIFKDKFPSNMSKRVDSIREFDKIRAQNGDIQSSIKQGIEKFYDNDIDESVRLLMIGAESNVGLAYGILGNIYYYGIGKPKDELLGLSYYMKGLDLGDMVSIVEVALITLTKESNMQEKLQAKTLLEMAAKEGNSRAIHYLGLFKLKGIIPYSVNISEAYQLFRIAKKKTYLPSIYYQAVMNQKGLGPKSSSMKALKKFMLFLELSFMFDDSANAWNSIADDQIEYGLRLYQGLAFLGSEASMWNSEMLCNKYGYNSSDWFNMQLKMGFHTALLKLAEQKEKEGKTEEAKNIYLKTSEKESKSSFALAWMNIWNPMESLKYLDQAYILEPRLIIAYYLSKIAIIFANIPQLLLFFWKDSPGLDMLFLLISQNIWVSLVGILLVFLHFFIGFKLNDIIE